MKWLKLTTAIAICLDLLSQPPASAAIPAINGTYLDATATDTNDCQPSTRWGIRKSKNLLLLVQAGKDERSTFLCH
jgi:hypothetical protein